jgi:hypothetical protein
VLVAQRPVGVDRDLGAGQVRDRPLELQHLEQVPVVGDVAAQAAGRGECQGVDAVPGSELDQFGGVRADLRSDAGGRFTGSAGGWLAPAGLPVTRLAALHEPLVPTTANLATKRP